MLAGVPLTFTLRLDAGAVDEQVLQRAGPAARRQAQVQSSLAAAQGAEVRDRPLQANAPKQALHEPGCLPQRHPEQHFQGQTGLDRGIVEPL